jgi:biotin operon repressor
MSIIEEEKTISAQFIATKLGISTKKVLQIMEILQEQGFMDNFSADGRKLTKICNTCNAGKMCSIKDQIQCANDFRTGIEIKLESL